MKSRSFCIKYVPKQELGNERTRDERSRRLGTRDLKIQCNSVKIRGELLLHNEVKIA